MVFFILVSDFVKHNLVPEHPTELFITKKGSMKLIPWVKSVLLRVIINHNEDKHNNNKNSKNGILGKYFS